MSITPVLNLTPLKPYFLVSLCGCSAAETTSTAFSYESEKTKVEFGGTDFLRQGVSDGFKKFP